MGWGGWRRQLCSCMVINAQCDPIKHRLQMVLLKETVTYDQSVPVFTGVVSLLLEKDNLYQDKHKA